jgi:hypothetical protein
MSYVGFSNGDFWNKKARASTMSVAHPLTHCLTNKVDIKRTKLRVRDPCSKYQVLGTLETHYVHLLSSQYTGYFDITVQVQ